jgi:hypothetical protein
MKKIYFLEASYRFIRIPVNQKFYDSHVKERAAAELLNSEHSHSHGQKFMALENTRQIFTDLVTFDVESGQSSQSIYYTRQTSKPSTR